jgi:hypothetical protein
MGAKRSKGAKDFKGPKSGKRKSGGGKAQNKPKDGKESFGKRGKGAPIVFDPDARKEYLQGFSERKKERRAYGLAMQKVKDRKAKLENRAEMKLAQKEQVEEAEKHKEELMAAVHQDTPEIYGIPVFDKVSKAKDNDGGGNDKPVPRQDDEPIEKVHLYQDEQTQSHWGGEVIVNISTHFPDESEDEANDTEERKMQRQAIKKTVDAQQQYAGNVEKFLSKVKQNMPSKKKKARMGKQKGNHGAAGMKGMAGSGDLKVAQSVLAKSQVRLGTGRSHGPALKGKKRKK